MRKSKYNKLLERHNSLLIRLVTLEKHLKVEYTDGVYVSIKTVKEINQELQEEHGLLGSISQATNLKNKDIAQAVEKTIGMPTTPRDLGINKEIKKLQNNSVYVPNHQIESAIKNLQPKKGRG